MRRFIFFLFVLNAINVTGQVTTWKAPEGCATDKYYSVKVNGVQVPVFDTPIASYAIFDFQGEANVEVNSIYDVRWVDIRPLRWNRKPIYTGDNSFTFKMKEPAHLSLELNGRIRQQPLLVFAGKPDINHPSKMVKTLNF